MHLVKTSLITAGLILSTHSVFSASVSIDWVNPDNYADIKNPTSQGRKAYRERVFGNLESQLAELAKQLPEDQQLTISVTDLKLAGRLRGNKVRVDPYVYPPRISFSYQLSDSQGMSLKQGEENLTGQRSSAPKGHSANDVSFYYEKAMLTDWFNKALISK